MSVDRHPLGRTCGDPRVLLAVAFLMPVALVRYALDVRRARPHKPRPPSKPPRKPINSTPIRFGRLLDHGFDVLPALLLFAAVWAQPQLNIHF